MALADRLVTGGPDKIPAHQFQALCAEWARGNITSAQALAAITQMTGVPLDQTAQNEAQNLINSVTSIPITGSATAIADGRARRALRMQEIDHVLLLADVGIPPYNDSANVKTRLGF